MVQVAARSISLHQVRTLGFGAGCATQCADYLSGRAVRSVFIVTAPPILHLCKPLQDELARQGRTVTIWSDIQQEPTVADFERTLSAARSVAADAIVGLGGGSAMDVAKLVAALLQPGGQSLSESFGIGKLEGRATTLVCLPTTSGTGSEVSPIAILLDEADQLKKGVISEYLVPDAAFVDPVLAVSMPPAVTAATGLDALTHCIEAYANRLSHPLVDTWALEGVRLIAKYLARAVQSGEDLEARTGMAQASLYGGLCLGPVNTAAVHALAYPLGGEFHVAHGVSNAVLLPHVLEFNLPAAPTRYADIAVALGVERGADALDTARRGVQKIVELLRACRIPQHLTELGITESAIERMARAAMTVTRLLERNVRVVTENDAREIYKKAL
jgi:alcohol dehydrogenase class IV